VLALSGVLVASVGAGTSAHAKGTATAGIASPSAKCKGGSVSAVVGGAHVCLKAGQKCKARYEPAYKKKGFHCANGRLQKAAAVKPQISIADATMPEGNSGTTPMSFDVTLSAASGQTVSVAWATSPGTATTPNDYQDTSGKLVFRPGVTSKTIQVGIVGDTLAEPDETFAVKLSEATNATIAKGSATGTITNDDAAKAQPGHFHGPITTGGFVDFDVSPDGSTVSNLVMLPFMTCNPSAGTGVYQISFASTSTIQPDLSFSASGSGSGITVSFDGKFTGDGSLAAGTLQIHLSYDDSGTHYECDTGSAHWAAALGS